MKAILFLALLCTVVFAEVQLHEDTQAFASWMAEHGKVYTSEEYPIRFQNFKASQARIEALNRKSNGGAVFGLDHLSDLSEAEFKNTILMKKTISVDNSDARAFVTPPNAPTSYDWRDKGAVTAVKNQEQCGSCWAFSATEAIESAWIIGGKSSNSINLAPQQIVDCDKSDGGCNGGWPNTAMQYVHNAGGQEGAANYPYTAKNGACAFKAQYVEAKISAYKTAATPKDEGSLQANLLAWGPLSICVDASSWNSYRGGVMTPNQCCTSCQLDHCVQLVGYNATASPAYWIVRNSWGAGWGIDGYIHLQMGGNTCALTNHATWPTL